MFGYVESCCSLLNGQLLGLDGTPGDDGYCVELGLLTERAGRVTVFSRSEEVYIGSLDTGVVVLRCIENRWLYE